MSVKVKICGITNASDAHQAVADGADALGFVLFRQSPRYVRPEVIKDIVRALPPFIIPVGVFVNEQPTVIREIMDQCGLMMAQIHGDETPRDCEELGRPVLRGIRLRNQDSFLALAEYRGRMNVRGFVLDAYSESAYGGTGHTADWDLAATAASSLPILLAGGLTPDNVQEAIQKVHPYGVDVSSGVESEPGKKDPGKLQRFIQAAKLVS